MINNTLDTASCIEGLQGKNVRVCLHLQQMKLGSKKLNQWQAQPFKFTLWSAARKAGIVCSKAAVLASLAGSLLKGSLCFRFLSDTAMLD